MDIYRGMLATKTAGQQWNTIINLILSSLGFVNNVIYHAIYTIQTKSIKGFLIVGCSIDDLLYVYYSTHLLKDFLSGINTYFPVTSKDVLNSPIITSPYGIII